LPVASSLHPLEGNLLDLFVRPVHDAGMRYVVAGSVASMYFSEPRLTIDVDIPILLGRGDLAVIESLFGSPALLSAGRCSSGAI
jgi:hypothetical protein